MQTFWDTSEKEGFLSLHWHQQTYCRFLAGGTEIQWLPQELHCLWPECFPRRTSIIFNTESRFSWLRPVRQSSPVGQLGFLYWASYECGNGVFFWIYCSVSWLCLLSFVVSPHPQCGKYKVSPGSIVQALCYSLLQLLWLIRVLCIYYFHIDFSSSTWT